MTWGALAAEVQRASTPSPAPREASARVERFALDLGDAGSLLRILVGSQSSTVTRYLGLTIPSMRAGHAKITKTPGTWPLRAWVGESLAKDQPTWLANPDPRMTRARLLALTFDDAIWHDRAYWRVTKRGADGFPLAFAHVPATEVTGTGQGIRVNGKTPREAFPSDPGPKLLADGRVLESFIEFTWEGLGGMHGPGSVVMDLALSHMNAATNYANSPSPDVVLVNESNVEMTSTEVEELLTAWETKRKSRSTAFAQGVKPTPFGFSSKDLQLVEMTEHDALQVARSLALPASAVDASNGASLEYSTTVENRRELVEALRLWTTPWEQALSLHATPRGVDVRLDVTSYLRDAAAARMGVWSAGIASGVLTVEEARSQEPLATGSAP